MLPTAHSPTTFALRLKTVAIATLIMVAVVLRGIVGGTSTMASADFPNPDSYYKLVLLQDHSSLEDLGFVARDNAPMGLWSHWSLPHSWTVWQLHNALSALGMEPRAALMWGGASLTVLCMLLLGALLALCISRLGTRNAALASTLMLASSMPLLAYGKFEQITHHVFMLVPLAAAAVCLLRTGARMAGTVGGGLLLGLALWISPETMPFITGLMFVRAALRMQQASTAPVWWTGAGLIAAVFCGWLLDPPPPGFSVWALDHISLAWLSYAGVIGALAMIVDLCIDRHVPLRLSLPGLALIAACAGAMWLLLVPGALAGPAGLIPAELKPLWWDHINELQPANTPTKFVAYFSVPFLGALVAAHAAWRHRSLWLLTLAAMALAYGVLGVWHTRMGAAAALTGTLAFGLGISHLQVFADEDGQCFTLSQQIGAFLLAIAGPLQLGASVGLAALENDEQNGLDCPLESVASALNALPAATILAPVFSGPELLYRTHHRVIAGPYHHNVDGILDNYRAWLDTSDERALEIIQRRRIDYVLACTNYQAQLRAVAPLRSLAQRAADGDVPSWLIPEPWPTGTESHWKLYRVQTNKPRIRTFNEYRH